ncbi:hypothetical protein ACWCPS_13915 [Streptomyces mauvecolor]
MPHAQAERAEREPGGRAADDGIALSQVGAAGRGRRWSADRRWSAVVGGPAVAGGGRRTGQLPRHDGASTRLPGRGPPSRAASRAGRHPGLEHPGPDQDFGPDEPTHARP